MDLIIRADDFGFSSAVNAGAKDALKSGLVKSIGLLINMPGALEAVRLIRDFPDVALGLHANLVVGSPISNPLEIPTLFQSDGRFITSKTYRQKLKNQEKIYTNQANIKKELEAQIHRFFELTGKLPDYIDTHAVGTSELFSVVATLASKYKLPFLAHDPKFNTNIKNDPKRLSSSSQFYMSGGLPERYIDFLGHEILKSTNDISYIVVHPGYLDDLVMKLSSFTTIRTNDVTMLTNIRTKNWIETHDIKLVSHRTLVGELE